MSRFLHRLCDSFTEPPQENSEEREAHPISPDPITARGCVICRDG